MTEEEAINKYRLDDFKWNKDDDFRHTCTYMDFDMKVLKISRNRTSWRINNPVLKCAMGGFCNTMSEARGEAQAEVRLQIELNT